LWGFHVNKIGTKKGLNEELRHFKNSSFYKESQIYREEVLEKQDLNLLDVVDRQSLSATPIPTIPKVQIDLDRCIAPDMRDCGTSDEEVLFRTYAIFIVYA
jgi:hypothetical protein